MEQTWFFLMILGFATAMVFLTIDMAIVGAQEAQRRITSWQGGGMFIINGFLWIVYSLVFCLLSGATVQYISPFAVGSGIPEVKSILSGLHLRYYLSFRALTAKIIGLVCAIGGGLYVGREGPYVVISAALANALSKFGPFRRIRQDQQLRFQVLSAACAAGVATTFGAPVGGVLFSIEVTSTYYLVQNLWKGFFTSVSAALFVAIIGDRGLSALFNTRFSESQYSGYTAFESRELVAFAWIGVIFGGLGALFIQTVARWNSFKKQYKILSTDRYGQIIAVSVATSIVTLTNFVPMYKGQNGIISDLFTDQPLPEWSQPNIFVNLSFYIVISFILTAMSITLPIPAGLYTPVFLIGAASGRLVGEVIAALVPSWSVVPGAYAVVGAAAFSAGVTRTLSTSVIVFELTGQLSHMLPVLISVLLATAVGNIFGPNVYDRLLQGKGLPYLPGFNAERYFNLNFST
eukprot:TRINITY_DN6369_c3_g1_i2.p1 TRINITY_DN6369_c3_g1~~TRINITY_DN6369_c3_g1_i2.p1  ORF type:complete len:531 (+),score=121.88 TRINITY_DN6369_c3_g1_i2:209-1594(+)